MKKTFLYFFLWLVITLYCPLLVFPLMLPVGLEELKEKADVVMRGDVKAIEGKWSRNKDVIVTQVSVEVTDMFKGRVKDNIVIVEYPGGEVDGIGLKVSDAPHFTTGEDVILFLNHATSKVSGRVYNVVEMAQGKYAIEEGIARKDDLHLFIEEGNTTDVLETVPVDELIKKISGDEGHSFIWIDRRKEGENTKEP